MEEIKDFNIRSGVKAPRRLLQTYVNIGSNGKKEWFPVGMGVEDSSIELNASTTTVTDIWGITETSVENWAPTQSFDPFTIKGGSKLAFKLHEIWLQKRPELLSQFEVLIVYKYLGDEIDGYVGEVHRNCTISVLSIGGSTHIDMPIEIHYSNDVEKVRVRFDGNKVNVVHLELKNTCWSWKDNIDRNELIDYVKENGTQEADERWSLFLPFVVRSLTIHSTTGYAGIAVSVRGRFVDVGYGSGNGLVGEVALRSDNKKDDVLSYLHPEYRNYNFKIYLALTDEMLNFLTEFATPISEKVYIPTADTGSPDIEEYIPLGTYVLYKDNRRTIRPFFLAGYQPFADISGVTEEEGETSVLGATSINGNDWGYDVTYGKDGIYDARFIGEKTQLGIYGEAAAQPDYFNAFMYDCTPPEFLKYWE